MNWRYREPMLDDYESQAAYEEAVQAYFDAENAYIEQGREEYYERKYN